MKLVCVQLDLPKPRITDIEKMMVETGVATRKDFFENALTFFEWAIQQRKAGRIIVTTDSNGNKPCELVMPALQNVKSA